jgi:hypothetical protein
VITERTINWTIQRNCQHCTQMTQEVDKHNTHKNNTKKKSKRMINMDPHQIPGMNHRCLWRYGHINLICLKQTPSMRALTMYMYIVCPWQAMGGLTYMSTTNWSGHSSSTYCTRNELCRWFAMLHQPPPLLEELYPSTEKLGFKTEMDHILL